MRSQGPKVDGGGRRFIDATAPAGLESMREREREREKRMERKLTRVRLNLWRQQTMLSRAVFEGEEG